MVLGVVVKGMTTSILKCRKCGFRFNYSFIPGASVSAVRLGSSRYMRCPKCSRFGLFNLMEFGTDPKLSTYSDSKITARYLPVIIVPTAAWIVLSLVWLRPLVKGPLATVLISVPIFAIVLIGVLLLLLASRLQKV